MGFAKDSYGHLLAALAQVISFALADVDITLQTWTILLTSPC
jgi:hypothetical protein